MKETGSQKARALFHLRNALKVTKVDRRIFPLGPATQDEIVTTNRFILILRGKLDYTIEGKTLTMDAGTQFFVPAWVRRVWSVPQAGPCEIAWCEFDEDSGVSNTGACFCRKLEGSSLAREKRSYLQLRRVFQTSSESEWRALQLEGELKAMLVRFWEEAAPASGRNAGKPETLHPRIKAMLRWAEKHYREADALETLYRESGMSRNYFRILFTRALRCGPHVYLERLRLRQARYLLHATDWQLKRIAAEVGYGDPLYFSKLYRRYWKHAPSRER